MIIFYKGIFIVLVCIILFIMKKILQSIINEKKGTLGDNNKQVDCGVDIFFLLIFAILLIACITMTIIIK